MRQKNEFLVDTEGTEKFCKEFEARVQKKYGIIPMREMPRLPSKEDVLNSHDGYRMDSVMFIPYIRRALEKMAESKHYPVLDGLSHGVVWLEETLRYSIADVEMQRKFYAGHKDDDFNWRGLNEQ